MIFGSLRNNNHLTTQSVVKMYQSQQSRRAQTQLNIMKKICNKPIVGPDLGTLCCGSLKSSKHVMNSQ